MNLIREHFQLSTRSLSYQRAILYTSLATLFAAISYQAEIKLNSLKRKYCHCEQTILSKLRTTYEAVFLLSYVSRTRRSKEAIISREMAENEAA